MMNHRIDRRSSMLIPRGRKDTKKHQESSLYRFPPGFHEGQTLLRQLLFVLEHPAPDLGGGGKFGESKPERLDGKRALVLDLLERREGFLPVHAAFSRRAAVILGNVDVDHDVGATGESARDVFFLDVGVKSVVHHAEV